MLSPEGKQRRSGSGGEESRGGLVKVNEGETAEGM